jgi:hypothetical protein
VVFDALSGGHKRRIEDLAALRVVETSAAIFDQRGDRAARDRARWFVQLLQQEAQPLDLNFRFRVVLLEDALKAR